MITLTDAVSIEPDDPIDIDPANIAALQVDRDRPNVGTIITLISGQAFAILEGIASVRKMIAEAKK